MCACATSVLQLASERADTKRHTNKHIGLASGFCVDLVRLQESGHYFILAMRRNKTPQQQQLAATVVCRHHKWLSVFLEELREATCYQDMDDDL